MALQTRIEKAIEALHATGSKAAAMGAFLYPSGYTFNGRGNFLSVAPRNFPYHNTDPLGNSAVVNTLGWVQANFPQAHVKLERKARKKGKDVEETVSEHPMLDLLWNPNPHYDSTSMWAGVLLSYFLDGNAYLIKVRNARGFGIPTALYYEPHWSLKPHAPSDGSQFIDYYERFVNGTVQKIPVENVIHFRHNLNPANPRYGLAPLKAALLQVFTDEEVSLWVAALCKNMAIPGVIVAPDQAIGMSKEKAEGLRQAWKRRFGGDQRGEPLFLDFPGTVTTLGYNPSDMDFTAISNKAETRVAGAFRVPPVVAGLLVGAESSTYNNLANLKKSAFEECLCPTWEAFENVLDRQLLPDFDSSGKLETCFETKHIRALQENEAERQDRERKNLEAGAITLNEYRAHVGQEPLPNGDVFYLPTKLQPVTADVLAQMASEMPQQPAPTDPNADPVNGPAKGLKKKSLEWEGMELSREPTELEAPIIKAIAASMDVGKQSLEGVLMTLREELILEATKDLEALEPDNYHALVLGANPTTENRVKVLLEASYRKGRDLVRSELGTQERIAGKAEEEAMPSIATLARITITRIINEVQTRAIEIAARLALLFGGKADTQAVKSQLEETSTGYVSKAAQGAANAAIAEGRRAEFDAQKDQISRYIYSAILDTNTCGVCALADGTESESVTMLAMTPNPLCDGGLLCRCLIIGVLKTEV